MPFSVGQHDRVPTVDAFVSLTIDDKIIEAECSFCHDVIFKGNPEREIKDQAKELREAMNWHTLHLERFGVCQTSSSPHLKELQPI